MHENNLACEGACGAQRRSTEISPFVLTSHRGGGLFPREFPPWLSDVQDVENPKAGPDNAQRLIAIGVKWFEGTLSCSPSSSVRFFLHNVLCAGSAKNCQDTNSCTKEASAPPKRQHSGTHCMLSEDLSYSPWQLIFSSFDSIRLVAWRPKALCSRCEGRNYANLRS
jgi:hypothetical protein